MGDVFVHVDGVVVDDKGTPIEGAKVMLVPDISRYPKGPNDEVTTTSSGEFSVRLTLEPRGPFETEFIVEAAGYQKQVRKYESGNPIATNQRIVLDREGAVRVKRRDPAAF